MIHQTIAVAASIALLSIATPSVAADAQKGRALARQCSACHGRTGVSNDPEVPIIAGQHAHYLEKSLKDFRDGNREDRRMSLIAQRLTDEKIADLAAWYASYTLSVEPPQ